MERSNSVSKGHDQVEADIAPLETRLESGRIGKSRHLHRPLDRLPLTFELGPQSPNALSAPRPNRRAAPGDG